MLMHLKKNNTLIKSNNYFWLKTSYIPDSNSGKDDISLIPFIRTVLIDFNWLIDCNNEMLHGW